MLGLLKRIRSGPPAEPDPPPFVPRVPDGERIYAIGDIHGRLDLFERLLDRIAADDAARGAARTVIILLGDLIDRGPASAQVVEKARQMPGAGESIVAIKGNHEEVLLSAIAGDEGAMRLFLRVGGLQTLDSYGIDTADLPEGTEIEVLADRMRATIPRVHLDYLESMADSVAAGDYLFVHAGVRPGIPLVDQDPVEQRWIRGSFLDNESWHGAMIVHGHSITPDAVFRRNRIGIDTGAYDSGVLTALGLEGGEQWLLQTGASDSPAPDDGD